MEPAGVSGIVIFQIRSHTLRSKLYAAKITQKSNALSEVCG